MNKREKSKKGLQFTLSAKITVMFGIIIMIMLVPLLLLIQYSNNYINQYDKVLSNISKLNYIETTTAAQPQRILNYCIINTNINSSGESEKIAEMIQYISDIKWKIGEDELYAQNLTQAVVVENLLNNYCQNYREGIGLCGGNFSLAGDVQFYTMNDISDYISKNCSTLLNLEMKRSADIQRKIAENYNNMRTNVFVLLVCAIIVAVVLVIFLQRKIARPVRLLSRKLAVIADKDLTDSKVEIHSMMKWGILPMYLIS